MPLPLLFIGIAAATGGLGVGKTIKAGIDVNNAKKTNKNANEIVETSTEWLNAQRMACGSSLRKLGEEKLFILNSSITEFLDTFSKIKNVDFRESNGLEELKKLHVDEKEFVELKSMVSFAGSLAGGRSSRNCWWSVGCLWSIRCSTSTCLCIHRNSDCLFERSCRHQCYLGIFRRRVACCWRTRNGWWHSNPRQSCCRSCAHGYGLCSRTRSKEGT